MSCKDNPQGFQRKCEERKADQDINISGYYIKERIGFSLADTQREAANQEMRQNRL